MVAIEERVDGTDDISIFDKIIVDKSMEGKNAAGPTILNEAATSTNPTLVPNRADTNTGIGWSAGDQLSLIAGSIEGLRLKNDSSGIQQIAQANVGLTAHVGSAQGNGVILSSFNVYSTVGSTGDAATLPSTFPVGTIIHVKNDAAANAMDVFPASGDDLGAGANTALSLTNGKAAIFLATVANTTWTNLLEGI